MKQKLLTLDVGNSRIKARRWSWESGRAPRAEDRFEAASAEPSLRELAAWIDGPGFVHDAAALSSVCAPSLSAAVHELLRARASILHDRRSVGLELAVRSPETVGDDRLFAARGGANEVGGSVIVVDAGTALTVDAVLWEERARLPRFLGGAIAPGPRLLAQALAQGTARLPQVEPRPGARALGKDTREALEAGVVVGFEGAAQRLVERVAAESGIAGPVLLSGGAAVYLCDVLPRARLVLDLVHRGLLAALGVWPEGRP